MNVRQLTSILLCALCAGCSVSPPPDGEIYHERDDQNISWTWQGGWGAWAQELDQEDLDLATGPGGVATYVGELDGAECYAITGGQWVCTLEIDGVTLLGQPLALAAHTPEDCAPLGPWVSAQVNAANVCYGVVGPLAVRLDLDRPLP